MYDLISICWLILGGLLEPIWLFALKKADNFKNLKYSVIAIVMMILSPVCLSFAMTGIPVGIAYAVWTGIGAVCAVGVGWLFFKEKISLKTVLFASLIIIGAVGLAYTGGSA